MYRRYEHIQHEKSLHWKKKCKKEKISQYYEFSWKIIFFGKKLQVIQKSSQCCKSVIMPITVERNEDWHQDIWMKSIHCLKLSGYRKVMSVRYSLEALQQSLQELTQDCQLVVHWCFWAEISERPRFEVAWTGSKEGKFLQPENVVTAKSAIDSTADQDEWLSDAAAEQHPQIIGEADCIALNIV